MRIALVLLLCLGLGACYTVRETHWDQASTKVGHLDPGDIVRVTTKGGKVHVFRVAKVEENAFEGVARDKKQYRIRREVIARLEVQRVHEHEHLWLLFPVGATWTGGTHVVR